jgi:hypothetical protein
MSRGGGFLAMPKSISSAYPAKSGRAKIIFLTRNNQKLHLVNDDGSLGKTVSDDLAQLRERLRETGTP